MATATLTKTNEETHAIAHRMLQRILDSGLSMDSEYCPTKGDSFGKVINDIYRSVTEKTLKRNGKFKDDMYENTYRGPRDTISLRMDKEPGFILKPSHFTTFERGKILQVQADGRTIAYEVVKGKNGGFRWLTLKVYFGYQLDDDGLGRTTQWWYSQSIEVNPTLQQFRCTLCADRVTELFLSGDPDAYMDNFGCVPCTATLDPKQHKLYLKARAPKKAPKVSPANTLEIAVSV